MIKSNRFQKIILLIGDVAIFYGALFLTLIIRYGALPSEKLWEGHKWPFFFVSIVWLMIYYIAGLYDVEKSANSAKITQIIRTMLAGTGIAVAMFYFIPSFNITPKTNLFIDVGIVIFLIWLWRKFFQKIIAGGAKIKVFFWDDSAEVAVFAMFINKNPQLGYETNDDALKADIIIISSDAKRDERAVNSLYEKVLAGKTVVDFDGFYESTTGMIPVSKIGKEWFLENMFEVAKQKFEKIKRFTDLIIASVLFIPFIIIFPFVALAIKLNSRGTILYRQNRVGKDGRIFQIIKFRSMFADAEKNGAEWAKKDDKRATFFGRAMRRTRIDELPQLWNVLKGDLSFVGPRPERPEFLKELTEKVPHYSIRQLVKPGLSGWAQINFPYGASMEDATQKLQYDLFYIKNRSLLLEFSIILKTIMTLIRKEGR